MLRALGLFLVLGLFWWLWSGHTSLLLLSFGLGSCLLVVWIALRMDVVDHEATPLQLTHRVPIYWLWLIGQILKANVDTSLRILRPKSRVQPVVADLPAEQALDLGRVIYANSITLTPGTLSMRLDEDSVEVHALHQDTIDDLKTGVMAEHVKRLEG